MATWLLTLFHPAEVCWMWRVWLYFSESVSGVHPFSVMRDTVLFQSSYLCVLKWLCYTCNPIFLLRTWSGRMRLRLAETELEVNSSCKSGTVWKCQWLLKVTYGSGSLSWRMFLLWVWAVAGGFQAMLPSPPLAAWFILNYVQLSIPTTLGNGIPYVQRDTLSIFPWPSLAQLCVWGISPEGDNQKRGSPKPTGCLWCISALYQNNGRNPPF